MTENEKLLWERKFTIELTKELGETSAAIIGFKIIVSDQEKMIESLLEKLKVYEQDSKLRKNNIFSLITYKVDKIEK